MASFFSPYSHEFVRLGACVPHVAVADPRQNADNVLDLLASGDKASIALMVFPELGNFPPMRSTICCSRTRCSTKWSGSWID